MKRIAWYPLLAAGALLAPLGWRAQAPQPAVREIATFPGIDVAEIIRMPNGKVLVYGTYEATSGAIYAYELASKRRTLVARGFDGNLSMTRAGDRIAYDHEAEDGKSDDAVWSIPINPATGAPAGRAQRVTVGEGIRAIFSPDGKSLSFAIRRTTTQSDLLVVPAVGGTERVIARFEAGYAGVTALKPMAWSDDGKWISVRVGSGRDSSTAIQRVPVDGGRVETIMSYATREGGSWGSAGGQVAFYRADVRAQAEGRMTYVTASGTHGEFNVPPGSFSGNLSSTGSPQTLLARIARPSTAYVLDVASGRVRDLLPGARLARSPVWSPDGRRLAIEDSAGGRYEITVMNADGSQPRTYAVSWNPANPGFMQWSADGQKVAYYAGGGIAAVGVLDLSTGVSRIVSSVSEGNFLAFIWRPDGKSLVVLKARSMLYEARLDGTERMLRDVGAEFRSGRVSGQAPMTPRAFISDRLLIVGNASQQFVVPTDSGPPRLLPAGTSPRVLRPGVSPSQPHEANRILWMVQNTGRPITSVDIMTSRGDSLRTLHVPIEIDRDAFHDSFFHPDGQHVVLVGKTPGDSVSKIFLVPLAGGAPRVLAPYTGQMIGRFDLSPDGKSLAYTLQGAPTSTIFELDVSPILQSIRKP
jgi:Tol biopolymer transport system component